MKIKNILAREILDSRGIPTVEVQLETDSDQLFVASVPSGTSTGSYEAHELRDGGARYEGCGVLHAVAAVNNIIAPAVHNQDILKQKEIDEQLISLDGTAPKKRLGVNAILAVSAAVARAGAHGQGVPLYTYFASLIGCKPASGSLRLIPQVVLMEGGVHADTNLDLQEFMIVPLGCASFAACLERAVSLAASLKHILRTRGRNTDVGMEGGFAPQMQSSIEAVECLIEAGQRLGLIPGKDFGLAFDVGASVLWHPEKPGYIFKLDHATYTHTDLGALWQSWLAQYPIISLEDPFAEDAWEIWSQFMTDIRAEYPDVLVVGDDLFATNRARLAQGIKYKAANAVIVKPNQIGTISETLAFVADARQAKMKIIVSHRSGETCDDWIADLAVGVDADYVKFGGPQRGERVAKYNRLLAIETELS